MKQVDFNGDEVEDTKPHLVLGKVRGTEWVIPEDYEGDPMTEKEIKFFKENTYGPMTPFTKCVACEEHLLDIVREYDEYSLRDGSYSDKSEGFVCFPCKESDDTYKNVVVVYDSESEKVTKWMVGDHFDEAWDPQHDDFYKDLDDIQWEPGEEWGESSPLQFRYVSTSAWRGYHEPVIPDGWFELHGDSILFGSGDAAELGKFHGDIKKFLWDQEIEFAVAYGLTSNLFSQSYTLLVHGPEDLMKSLKLIGKTQSLKRMYRDRDRFVRTALTGSSEDTKEGNLLVKAHDLLEEGKDLDEVLAVIRREM